MACQCVGVWRGGMGGWRGGGLDCVNEIITLLNSLSLSLLKKKKEVFITLILLYMTNCNALSSMYQM